MSHHSPLVTIGIPVYNAERCLPTALNCIVSQTYQNLEIIISDNGSTDETQAICERHASTDNRIRYYRSEENWGVFWNFNRLVGLASGEYFMWVAADDVRPDNAVELLVQACRKNPAATMAHGPILLKQTGQTAMRVAPNAIDLSMPKIQTRIRNFTRGLNHNAMVYGMFRRTAMENGFPVGPPGGDYLLCLQMASRGPVEYIDAPMMVYDNREAPAEMTMGHIPSLHKLDIFNVGAGRRGKCSRVLLLGAYLLATDHSLSSGERVKAAVTHVVQFGFRYWQQIPSELVFQVFWLIGRLAKLSSRTGRGLKRLIG